MKKTLNIKFLTLLTLFLGLCASSYTQTIKIDTITTDSYGGYDLKIETPIYSLNFHRKL